MKPVTLRSPVVMSTREEQDLIARIPAPLMAALTTVAVLPPEAEAAVTPSLKNLLLSLVYGGILAAVLGIAVVGVSSFDTVNRK